ncbi:hypothetical protein ASE74_08720 [Pedobacter sp. Leaf216]|nr:hypothetical protein ASE74_08720 [Pedobacter sp. Leaf216]
MGKFAKFKVSIFKFKRLTAKHAKFFAKNTKFCFITAHSAIFKEDTKLIFFTPALSTVVNHPLQPFFLGLLENKY